MSILDNSVVNILAIAVCIVVYGIGSYVILKWTCHRLLCGYWRLTLRRHNGIPYPVLEAWDEEIEWRRERGFSSD